LTGAFAGGPLIVTALFGPGDDGWLQHLRRTHYPPEQNRVPAHLTLFRHLPPGAADELGRRLARVTAAPAPEASVAGIMDLGPGTALRVSSPGLEAIRADLAEAFFGLLIPADQAGWRPHVTIQNKVRATQAREVQRRLAATIQPRPLAIAGLAIWHYRADGHWEQARRFPFRF
jgi:hypothetical protein